MDLDFEEISEDELEEEARVKGLGDALGVDWASLVAESKPRVKPITSAKIRWEPHNVLVNLGVSVELAGENLVKDILREHVQAKLKETKAHLNNSEDKYETVKKEGFDKKNEKEKETGSLSFEDVDARKDSRNGIGNQNETDENVDNQVEIKKEQDGTENNQSGINTSQSDIKEILIETDECREMTIEEHNKMSSCQNNTNDDQNKTDYGQNRLDDGQNRIVDDENRTVEGQNMMVEDQNKTGEDINTIEGRNSSEVQNKMNKDENKEAEYQNETKTQVGSIKTELKCVDEKSEEEIKTEEIVISHPIAAMQVANREEQMIRKSLFSSAGPYSRALCARRDLMIRRHLCNLPINDAFAEAPKRHDPEILQMAIKFLERCA